MTNSIMQKINKAYCYSNSLSLHRFYINRFILKFYKELITNKITSYYFACYKKLYENNE